LTENQNQQSKKVFCTAPFFNLYYKGNKDYNKIMPCCEGRLGSLGNFSHYEEYSKSKWLRNIRKKMLNNEPAEICTRCVSVEEAGGFNAREHYRNLLEKIEFRTKEKVEFNFKNGNQHGHPMALDYRGSNLCNLKCRMCHQGSSSEIAKEINKNQDLYRPMGYGNGVSHLYINNKLPNEFIDELKLDNVYRFKILGGEPLMQEDVYIGLEKMAQLPHRKEVDISFTTNATNFPKRFYDLIGKFRRILMRVSLDGVDDVFEYCRSNGNWDKIMKNITSLSERGYTQNELALGFSFVIQFYNVFRIYDIMEWCAKWEDEHPVETSIWSMHTFFSPIEQNHLSTAMCTTEDREFLRQELDRFLKDYGRRSWFDRVENIIFNFDENRNFDKEKAKETLIVYSKNLDKIRKTNLPDLHERYSKYYE
jgi:MoaA/NifB/PqqE/SkfB family radical SAM enzyme